MEKTFKREMGVAAAIAWAVMTLRLFSIDEADMVQALSGAYTGASLSLWGFIGAVFVAHHVKRPPPKRSKP